jgi:hypothetical protein
MRVTHTDTRYGFTVKYDDSWKGTARIWYNGVVLDVPAEALAFSSASWRTLAVASCFSACHANEALTPSPRSMRLDVNSTDLDTRVNCGDNVTCRAVDWRSSLPFRTSPDDPTRPAIPHPKPQAFIRPKSTTPNNI